MDYWPLQQFATPHMYYPLFKGIQGVGQLTYTGRIREESSTTCAAGRSRSSPQPASTLPNSQFQDRLDPQFGIQFGDMSSSEASVHVIVSLECSKENLEEVRSLCNTLVAGSRKEAGTVYYHFEKHEDAEENKFLIVEKYVDANALDAHNNSSHFTTIVPQLAKKANFNFIKRGSDKSVGKGKWSPALLPSGSLEVRRKCLDLLSRYS
jgi:quinol monooxygenase YgiN